MAELIDAHRAVDIVTLAEELARRKEVEAVGGVAYLASLTEGLPRRPSIEEYVRIVKDKSLARQLIVICNTAITRAADQSDEALVVLDPPSPACWKSRSAASPADLRAFRRSFAILSGPSTICTRSKKR